MSAERSGENGPKKPMLGNSVGGGGVARLWLQQRQIRPITNGTGWSLPMRQAFTITAPKAILKDNIVYPEFNDEEEKPLADTGD